MGHTFPAAGVCAQCGVESCVWSLVGINSVRPSRTVDCLTLQLGNKFTRRPNLALQDCAPSSEEFVSVDYRSQQFPQPCCICFRPAKQVRSTRQTIYMAHATKNHGLVHGGGPVQKESSSPRGGNSAPRHVEYTVPFFAQSFFEGKAFRPLAGSQATSSNFHRNSPIPPKNKGLCQFPAGVADSICFKRSD